MFYILCSNYQHNLALWCILLHSVFLTLCKITAQNRSMKHPQVWCTLIILILTIIKLRENRQSLVLFYNFIKATEFCSHKSLSHRVCKSGNR
jgi:hypothetical protein